MARGSNRKNANGLNAKQQKFADRYLLNGNNAAEAYRYAYGNKKCTDKQAAVNGQKILVRNADISRYIDETQKRLQEKASEQEGITRESILKKLSDLAFGNVVETDVAERYTGGKMDGVHKEKTISRWAALEKLITMLGFDKKEVHLSGNVDGAIEIDFQTVEEYLKNGSKGG